MGQLPSARDTITSDTTTSATYEDVDGLTVQLTVDNTSDILLLACVTATGSTSAKGGWRLVFDGTNYLDLERHIDSEPANINLVDLVSSKGAGTYTFKLQHRVDTGTLTTTNAMITAVSLHNGDGVIPAESDYVATETVGNAWEDILGLSVSITLSKTSHIWAMLVLNGYHSGANKDTDFAINIDATRMEEHDRDTTTADEYGCVSVVTRTATEKTAGSYTVKAEWRGSGGSTYTGEDIKLVVIAGEADTGAANVHITKDVVVSDTTTATAKEDITGLSVTASPEETAHILAVMTLSTDISVANSSAYTVIDINGTDSLTMERGHAAANRWGSIGQTSRTASALTTGDYTVKGEWYTDSGNTLSGANIVLTSIVLAATLAETTAYLDRNLSLEIEQTGYLDRNLLLEVELTGYLDRDFLLDVNFLGYEDRSLTLEVELIAYEDLNLSLDINYLGFEDRSFILDTELPAFEDRSLLLDVEQTAYVDRSLLVDIEIIAYEDRSLSLDINYLNYEDRTLTLEVEILTYEDRPLSLDVNYLGYEDQTLTLDVELTSYFDRDLLLDIYLLGYLDRNLSLDVELWSYFDRSLVTEIELITYLDRDLILDILYLGYEDRSLSLEIEQDAYEDRSLTLEVELIDFLDRSVLLDIEIIAWMDRSLLLSVEQTGYEDRDLSLDLILTGYEDWSLILDVSSISYTGYNDRDLLLSIDFAGYTDRSFYLLINKPATKGVSVKKSYIGTITKESLKGTVVLEGN